MTEFTPPIIPAFLRNRRQWLVWRLVNGVGGGGKPRKVPFYVNGSARNGDQGTPEDIDQLATYQDAVDAVQQRGYTGLGFALLAGSGIVALDFDHCVKDGQVLDKRIDEVIAGTYAEISPSGTGLRAFFRGELRSRKDNAPKLRRVGGVAGAPRLDGLYDVEVFANTGFVTITGDATQDTLLWGLQDHVEVLTPAALALYEKRFGTAPDQSDYHGAKRLVGGAGGAGGVAGGGGALADVDLFGDGAGLDLDSHAGQEQLSHGRALAHRAGGAGGVTDVTDVTARNRDNADLEDLGPDVQGWTIREAREYLFDCDASTSRDEWLNALMAIHYEFGGSAEALDLVDEWSATGDSYAGRKDVEGRWRSFGRRSGGAPITGRWLLKWRREQVSLMRETRMRDALGELGKLIAEAPDMLTLQTKTLPRVAELITEHRVLEIEAYSLFAARAKAFGASVTKVEFKKLVRQETRVTVDTYTPAMTEFGNAERMIRKHAGGIIYVPEIEQWYVWTGIYWRPASGNRSEISGLVRETVLELPNEAHLHDGKLDEFHRFCSMSQRAQMLKAVVAIAEADNRVRVPYVELDKIPHLLGVRNGVVDLRTGALIPADPEYFITMVTACPYLPDAKAPEFVRALRDAFYDSEPMMDFVLRSLGYSLLGNPAENVMFVAFGSGANGKGTIIDSARKAMGGYGRVVAAETFTGDSRKVGTAGGPREDLVRLRGARMLFVSELEEHAELKEGLVKSMTGGDTIMARGINARASVEIEPTWAIFMPTNYKPLIRGDDNGIWRRIRLIPFERDMANDPAIRYDKELKNRIAANELPGVLTLMVKGALRYQQSGLAVPDPVEKASYDYRGEQDLLAEWIETHCEIGNFKTPSSELWESWKEYAEKNGILKYVASSRSLGRRLDPKYPAKKGTGGLRMRLGIRVKPLEIAF